MEDNEKQAVSTKEVSTRKARRWYEALQLTEVIAALISVIASIILNLGIEFFLPVSFYLIPNSLVVVLLSVSAGIGIILYVAVNLHQRQTRQRQLAIERLKEEEEDFFASIEKDISTLLAREVRQVANQQIEAISKDLHPQAEKLAKDYINDVAISLLLQAKTLTYQRKADVVLSSHVEEARDIITRGQKQTWSREPVIVVGGALFGAFIQGFITELSTGRAFLVAVYTVLDFLGMLLVFWGLRR